MKPILTTISAIILATALTGVAFADGSNSGATGDNNSGQGDAVRGANGGLATGATNSSGSMSGSSTTQYRTNNSGVGNNDLNTRLPPGAAQSTGSGETVIKH